ncbi:hypothetical protein ACQ4M4_13645 [Leptolyngbya sp. AN02str]|uniref:hypothetical protein n=1 Tax=Leptolyngbya sp. AN02str TaxID=3423363 RepID=UPI003D30F9FD
MSKQPNIRGWHWPSKQHIPGIPVRSRLLRQSVLAVITALCCVGLGLGLATATTPPPTLIATGGIDPVPEQLQLGQQLYVRECATCHVAPPPAVLPLQTWANLLPNPNHYGVQITPLQGPVLQTMWNYVRYSSRSRLDNEDDIVRLNQSRFFNALHPGVDVPRPVNITGCVSCHPGAPEFNYRPLRSP